MAAKREKAQPFGLKRIMKPIITTDMMGNRNVEIKPVGAWAEPATFFSAVRIPEAVKAAQREEERIEAMQREKEERLRQFQEDVKKRVQHISKVKREQQLQNDFKRMEKQHADIHQSLRSSEHLLGRKDRIMRQIAPPISIKPPPPTDEEHEGQRKVFEEHNEQVHTFTSQARQKLVSRRLAENADDSAELPGGRWQRMDSGLPRTAWGEPDEYDDERDGLEKFREDEREGEVGQQKGKNWGQEQFGLGEEDSDDDDNDDDQDRLRSVQFDLHRYAQDAEDEAPTTVKGTSRKKSSHFKRPTSALDLREGIQEDEEKRLRAQQMLNYRRLYSDLERQKVREHERRKKQRAHVMKIKKEKEEWRRYEEDQARRLIEPRDPVTGETFVETNLREQMERTHVEEVIQEREEHRQKQKEMTRYLDALRKNLRDKLRKQGTELPALCCCGETLWDTHPDTCANNCFFYKNHRAYARALQSLLTSSEVM